MGTPIYPENQEPSTNVIDASVLNFSTMQEFLIAIISEAPNGPALVDLARLNQDQIENLNGGLSTNHLQIPTIVFGSTGNNKEEQTAINQAASRLTTELKRVGVGCKQVANIHDSRAVLAALAKKTDIGFMGGLWTIKEQ